MQCENETITETRTETRTDTITETRMLLFDEIEAPEEVSVSSKNFEIILKNTCYDDGCGIDYLHCYEFFSWVTDRKNNKLELTPQALRVLTNREMLVCQAFWGI